MNNIFHKYKKWNIVYMEPQSPFLHMAIDEVLLEELVMKPDSMPILRFWEWDSPAVIIGRFQSVKNEINIIESNILNIPIVRRITGGGAMFVEPENTITYSIIIPIEHFINMSFQESYKYLDTWVIDFFNSIGIEAYYKPLNDICTNIGKIGGAAQSRKKNAILHHVTISYKMNYEHMMKILRIGKEKLSDKGIESAIKRVDPLINYTNKSRTNIIKGMIDFFQKNYNATFNNQLNENIINKAIQLSKSKFQKKEWLYTIP
ncbi:Octanoyltransferase LipM [Candidatus Kinetoplastibacterium sorsogonicusi]|uniref:Octanoyltransferase LipM n=1 Tax=Candidatus Kinetoplastidibacterium kentomonadis TaxID=1576550 RepID=A0A3Q8ERB3_9PROT|nr:biotin/lipoate A/B protein ligase family protein [Candidatus Kinetoplastibacterium sorsogonicusi]AWD32446.1 Octanoyltransferase LipM [Candidatus Kinetoplastibacterium sorsogonicusi]